MTWVDWVILAVVAASTLGGLAQGFFRAVFSLGGLIFGLALASWNYPLLTALLRPIVKIDAVANAIGFLLIALLVMALANVVGSFLAKTFHRMGLGCLDALAGAVFGFVQGALLVTVCILVTVAFFPGEQWLAGARLPQIFFGACHLSTHVTPSELGERVRNGLRLLEQESPQWMHSGGVS
jgi:membrane protein required for colicin V production